MSGVGRRRHQIVPEAHVSIAKRKNRPIVRRQNVVERDDVDRAWTEIRAGIARRPVIELIARLVGVVPGEQSAERLPRR